MCVIEKWAKDFVWKDLKPKVDIYMVITLLDRLNSYKKALAVVYLYLVMEKVQARYLKSDVNLLIKLGTARKVYSSEQQ